MHRIVLTRESLARIIQRHGGNRSSIGRSEGWSLNTIRKLISEHGLTRMADCYAVHAVRSGPRESADDVALSLERERILQALRMSVNAKEAAKRLRMSVATLYRRRRYYKITDAEIVAVLRHL